MTVNTKTTIDRAILQKEEIAASNFLNTNNGDVVDDDPDFLIIKWPDLETANKWIDYTKNMEPPLVTVVVE